MTTEWNLLPVPAPDYEELKALVETRQAERGEPIAPRAEQITSDDAAIAAVRAAAYAQHRPWPESALARLAEGASLTTQRWAKVMDLLAENPGLGNELSTSNIVAKTDLSLNEWRDACRKMRPHLEKNYPDVPIWHYGIYEGEPMWPLVAISGKSLKVYDELYVGITAEQAKRWRSIR